MSAPEPDFLHRLLRERFGLKEFRGQQEQVIRRLLDGQSALVLFPTGAGKSLCYQLPALCFDGITLVVSPLIALMKDQVESLRRRGLPAARLDSTIADDETQEVFEQLRAGELKLLFLSPERLASRVFLREMRGIEVSMLAIDEAHCISEWGHQFRPDYLKIARVSRRLKVGRIIALTATATTHVARDIRKGFRIPREGQFHSGFHRPNLHLIVEPCHAKEKDARLQEHLLETDGPTVVYATSRQDTERIATMLQKRGFAARAYHAGLTPEVRAQAQDSFVQGRTRIIVATIAFGMGIDMSNIRSVIHYHLPKSLEGYSQEIGRAGRDGKISRCILFAYKPDAKQLENFIHAATPSPQALRNLLDRLLRLAEPGKLFAISPYELSVSLDLREETLRSVIAYLEMDELIERCGQFYVYLRVKLLRSLDRVVAGYPSREKQRIQRLFAAAEHAYGSWHFRLNEIEEMTGIKREHATEIIESLALAGDVSLEQRGMREVYQRSKKKQFVLAQVIDQMIARFEGRASFEFERIRKIIRYVETSQCRARVLAKHFGVALPPPCGTCNICLGDKPLRWRDETLPPIPAEEWQQMLDLRREDHAALGTPRQLAKFLCGISSPASYKAKLQSRDEFGMWQHRDFLDILAMLEA